MKRDPALDALLDLDGVTMVIDPDARYVVRFVVTSVPVSEAKTHGLDYSLTLNGALGERLVGFDNGHPVRSTAGPGGSNVVPFDHKHRLKTVRPYGYSDASTLLADFWRDVESVLAERGVTL